MKFLNNVYQYINILSLDVVTGAVIGAYFFAALFHVDLTIGPIVVLALSVWVIYTLDHLRDAMTIPKIATTDRHRFHQKYFRYILAVVLLVGATDFILLWFLPAAILRVGWMLGAIVVAYLVLQRYLRFLKELFVACLYTAGVLLPSIVMTDAELHHVHYLIIAKFFITAWMNLLLFSFFDYREDTDHRQHSFVTWFGPQSTRVGIVLLGSINIITGYWLWAFDARVALIFVLMNLLLLTVLFLGRQLVTYNLYRILGDAVFFIPAIYFL